jgi:hypothetical protein
VFSKLHPVHNVKETTYTTSINFSSALIMGWQQVKPKQVTATDQYRQYSHHGHNGTKATECNFLET